MVEKQARKRRRVSRGLNGLTNRGLIQRSGSESEMELLKGGVRSFQEKDGEMSAAALGRERGDAS